MRCATGHSRHIRPRPQSSAVFRRASVPRNPPDARAPSRSRRLGRRSGARIGCGAPERGARTPVRRIGGSAIGQVDSEHLDRPQLASARTRSSGARSTAGTRRLRRDRARKASRPTAARDQEYLAGACLAGAGAALARADLDATMDAIAGCRLDGASRVAAPSPRYARRERRAAAPRSRGGRRGQRRTAGWRTWSTGDDISSHGPASEHGVPE